MTKPLMRPEIVPSHLLKPGLLCLISPPASSNHWSYSMPWHVTTIWLTSKTSGLDVATLAGKWYTWNFTTDVTGSVHINLASWTDTEVSSVVNSTDPVAVYVPIKLIGFFFPRQCPVHTDILASDCSSGQAASTILISHWWMPGQLSLSHMELGTDQSLCILSHPLFSTLSNF